MRRRKNPPSDLALSAVKPFMPYIAVGVILYLFKDKLFYWFTSGVTGLPVEEIKKDVATIKSGSVSEVAKYLGSSVAAAVGINVGLTKAENDKFLAQARGQVKVFGKPANWDKNNKFMLEAAKTALGYKLKPANQTEFRRNVDILNTIQSWG